MQNLVELSVDHGRLREYPPQGRFLNFQLLLKRHHPRHHPHPSQLKQLLRLVNEHQVLPKPTLPQSNRPILTQNRSLLLDHLPIHPLKHLLPPNHLLPLLQEKRKDHKENREGKISHLYFTASPSILEYVFRVVIWQAGCVIGRHDVMFERSDTPSVCFWNFRIGYSPLYIFILLTYQPLTDQWYHVFACSRRLPSRRLVYA